jgi:hypothetical protein
LAHGSKKKNGNRPPPLRPWCGYSNVAKSKILHTARDADKESDLWMEMLNGSLSHGGGPRYFAVSTSVERVSADART